MLPKGIKLHKKQTKQHNFDFTNKNDIAELSQALKDIENKYPIVASFLEKYCGFYTPMNQTTPELIMYSAGKRDVILMIKTIMRDDINPDDIATYYKRSI